MLGARPPTCPPQQPVAHPEPVCRQLVRQRHGAQLRGVAGQPGHGDGGVQLKVGGIGVVGAVQRRWRRGREVGVRRGRLVAKRLARRGRRALARQQAPLPAKAAGGAGAPCAVRSQCSAAGLGPTSPAAAVGAAECMRARPPACAATHPAPSDLNSEIGGVADPSSGAGAGAGAGAGPGAPPSGGGARPSGGGWALYGGGGPAVGDSAHNSGPPEWQASAWGRQARQGWFRSLLPAVFCSWWQPPGSQVPWQLQHQQQHRQQPSGPAYPW